MRQASLDCASDFDVDARDVRAGDADQGEFDVNARDVRGETCVP